MRSKLIILVIGILFTTSCATIPVESIELMSAIQKEGERMNKLNIILTDNIFKEKRKKIDEFIKLEYTPKFMEEFTKNIPAGVDVKKELPNIMLSVIPKINERRDAMQDALELNRKKVIEKLNADYQEFKIAGNELKALLESAVKLNEEKRKLLSQASKLTNNQIDFDELELKLDNFIKDSGDLGNNINNLNDNVNSLLTK